MRTALIAAMAVFVAVVAAGRAPAQPAALDLSGTWTFDTYLSDSPQQVAAAIRADLAQGEPGIFSDSAEGGRFGRGMGRRGQPPAGTSNRAAQPENAEDQRTLDAITQSVRYPTLTLHITESANAVTIGDPQGQSRTFQVNGKREPQTFDTARAESTARIEGPQLLVDFDLGKGRKMTYTYSIVPTTHQLMVRVTFERAPNQPGSFEIKFVYNRASAGSPVLD